MHVMDFDLYKLYYYYLVVIALQKVFYYFSIFSSFPVKDSESDIKEMAKFELSFSV